MKGRAEVSACSQWEYDTSEFKDTAVTENNWVCNEVSSAVVWLAV